MKITPKNPVEEFMDEANDENMADDQEEKEEAALDPLDAIAEQFPDAPGRNLIEGWKVQYASVFAYIPDNDTLFLLRPLRRLEHKSISADLRQVAETARAKDDPSFVEDQLHEKVIGCCMLHPRMDQQFLTMSPAGLVPTLFNLVMEHSKFVSPENAMRACYRL
jgi:hypothetical protein